MNQTVKQFCNFMDGAHSSYHAVALLKDMLQKAGYTELSEGERWQLQADGKYYVTRGGSGLLSFRIPGKTPVGFMLSASHSDRPSFQMKENGELTGAYTRWATEKYGGMLMSTWLDRPLSVAGRVLVETETGIQSRLVDIDRDLVLVPNVAIHMNRKANEGVAWNPAVDTLPLIGGKDCAGKLWQLLEEAAGGKILGHDLYLYIRQKAAVWGVEEEYISAQGLDDIACAWCCTKGFLESEESNAVPVLCVFDSEEVGSQSAQGADSDFLAAALRRIAESLELPLEQLLHRSYMISADNAHGMHPNHPEYADAQNAPLPGQGVVLKYNAARKYTTDGLSGAIFRKLCQGAQVPMQTYYNRADLPGGSTLGCISLGHTAVPTADIGLPQLAMHSCYETVAVADVCSLEALMKHCYSSHLEGELNGSFTIRRICCENA